MVLVLGLAALPGSTVQAQPPDTEIDESLPSIFSDSALEFGIPADLLIAVAWTRSRLRNQASESDEYGLMQLSAQNPNQVEQAAQLLGVSASEIQFDNRQNVRGAAALLRQIATRKYPGKSALTAAEWFEVVTAFSFPGVPGLGRDHAQQIFTVLSQGLVAQINGETLVVNVWPDAGPLSSQPRIGIASVDYAPARWIAAHASNYTDAQRTPANIDTIVIHTTESGYSAAINWFTQADKYSSAHYLLRSRDGDVTQMVLDEDVAWHAGHWNTNLRSIGVEHEAFVDDASWYTDAMYRASAQLVRHLAQKYNIPLDRQHIVGHVEIPGCPYSGGGASCHTDPGPHWNWDYYMSLLHSNQPATATPLPTLIPTPTPAATTGTLAGLMVDGITGARIPGVTVLVEGQVTQSNSSGYYQLDNLSPGVKIVAASHPAYSAARQWVEIVAGQTRWGSFWLAPVAGAPTATPSRTPSPAATPSPTPAHTATPTPTATPSPTITPIPPTLTPTATPSPAPSTPTGETGNLIGIISNSKTNARLAGAWVSAGGQTVQANQHGVYVLAGLPVGQLPVTVEYPGFVTTTQVGRVEKDTTRWNSIWLEPLPEGSTSTPQPTETASPPPEPTATAITPATATPTPAAPDETGSLVGLIRDAGTGERLAGVTVAVLGQVYVTDERGYYRFDRLPAGVQLVTAEKEGYVAEHSNGEVVADEVRWNSILLKKE